MTYGEIVNDMASWLPPDTLGLKVRVVQYVRNRLQARRLDLDAVIPAHKLRKAEQQICKLYKYMLMQLRYERYIDKGSETPRQEVLERLIKSLFQVSRFMSPTPRFACCFLALKQALKPS